MNSVAGFINSISVKNFKTLKDVSIELKNVTVVIGDPNTGKSNLLECISLLDVFWRNNHRIREMVRMENMQNLFTDELIDRAISIKVNEGDRRVDAGLRFNNGIFQSHLQVIQEDTSIQDGMIIVDPNFIADRKHSFEFDGRSVEGMDPGLSKSSADIIRFYKYKDLHSYPNNSPSPLFHPSGDNLFRVVYSSKDLREYAKSFLETFNFSLVFRPQSNTFEIQKQLEDILVNLPYTTLADTIKQILFYSIAILSNTNQILLFEEPEGHTFPYYTKYLAQLIADNLTNQYVLVTHNPYFLRTLIEKVPKGRINVLIAYIDGFNTKFHQMTEDQLSQVLEIDPFFNLEEMID